MSAIAHGRLCILSKLVHASERQWCRLVIPGAVMKLWQAMQRVRLPGWVWGWVLGGPAGGCWGAVGGGWVQGGVAPARPALRSARGLPHRPPPQELKATGSDFTLIVQSPDGKQAWRFGARMTVQASRRRRGWVRGGWVLQPARLPPPLQPTSSMPSRTARLQKAPPSRKALT